MNSESLGDLPSFVWGGGLSDVPPNIPGIPILMDIFSGSSERIASI